MRIKDFPDVLTMVLLAAVVALALDVRVASAATQSLLGWLLELDTAGMQSYRGLQYGLQDSTGRLVPLGRNIRMPLWDSSNVVLQPGAWVNITCQVDPASGYCSSIAWTDVAILPGPTLPWTRTGAQNRLVVILDYKACGCAATISEAEVRGLLVSGMATKLSQCSYGKATLTSSSFTVVRVTPPCTKQQLDMCNPWDAANSVRATTAGLPAGFSFSNYNHFTYILPQCMWYSCSWSGVATTAMAQAWLVTPPTSARNSGVRRWATVMQGNLVNYGLRHAWWNDKEAADNTTCTASGVACPNAPELAWLGWATAASEVNSAQLVTGSTYSFTLPATYLTGSGAYLRIKPDWIGGARNLYVSVRMSKGGDVDMDRSYSGRFHVHEVAADLDNAMASGAYQRVDDRKVTLISTGRAIGGVALLSSYKLVLYGGNWTRPGSDTLVIYICRYGNSNSAYDDCPSSVWDIWG